MVRGREMHRVNYLKVFFHSICLLFGLWILPFLYGGYADTTFPFIAKENIAYNLVGIVGEVGKGFNWCLPMGDNLHGIANYNYNLRDSTLFNQEVFANARKIQPGGIWQPFRCQSRFEVALIIPFRNRTEHLNRFLSYMHPFLQAQNLFYRIFVIEQFDDLPFNRGKLFNIGYAEASKLGRPKQCLIFHDVDLIPQNSLNIYACTHEPRHMYSALNTFRYNLPYRNLVGGAIAIVAPHFELVNGFSNRFEGWGGEDDDFSARLSLKGLEFIRFDPEVATYLMLTHRKAKPSPNRFKQLSAAEDSYKTDGLSSLTYTVHTTKFMPLYTQIVVSW